jgi:hypothetical protein
MCTTKPVVVNTRIRTIGAPVSTQSSGIFQPVGFFSRIRKMLLPSGFFRGTREGRGRSPTPILVTRRS